MTRSPSSPPPPSPARFVGDVLREWRAARRVSQLALALEAGVSARHLSYVENGKSQPSREMVARLADTLKMPLRERNALLVTAGYAPEYPQSDLETPKLTHVRQAIQLIVDHQEPYPAFVLNRRWDILLANRAAARVADFVAGGTAHANMLRQFFDPNDVRSAVVNWEEVAGELIHHLHEEIAAAPSDARARELLTEILAYPDVPKRWRTRDVSVAAAPLLTVIFRKGEQELHFFSTIATFGTPRDITLEDLRIECVFPADDSTAELCRALAAADGTRAH